MDDFLGRKRRRSSNTGSTADRRSNDQLAVTFGEINSGNVHHVSGTFEAYHLVSRSLPLILCVCS